MDRREEGVRILLFSDAEARKVMKGIFHALSISRSSLSLLQFFSILSLYSFSLSHFVLTQGGRMSTALLINK